MRDVIYSQPDMAVPDTVQFTMLPSPPVALLTERHNLRGRVTTWRVMTRPMAVLGSNLLDAALECRTAAIATEHVMPQSTGDCHWFAMRASGATKQSKGTSASATAGFLALLLWRCFSCGSVCSSQCAVEGQQQWHRTACCSRPCCR